MPGTVLGGMFLFYILTSQDLNVMERFLLVKFVLLDLLTNLKY